MLPLVWLSDISNQSQKQQNMWTSAQKSPQLHWVAKHEERNATRFATNATHFEIAQERGQLNGSSCCYSNTPTQSLQSITFLLVLFLSSFFTFLRGLVGHSLRCTHWPSCLDLLHSFPSIIKENFEKHLRLPVAGESLTKRPLQAQQQ